MMLLCGTADSAYAQRSIPIPIVWGYGEELTDLGELPPDAARSIAKELRTPVTVAFLHERAHIFLLDLWTWNGRHVLHSADKRFYWELDSTAWQELIGGDPSAKYGKPILYRIPLLPALLVVAVVGYALRKRFFKTEQEKLEALITDRRYQRSLQILCESAKSITTLDEQRFLRAKNELIGEGVDAHSAETNLRKIADRIFANTNSQIDDAFAAASRLDQQGDWDKSAEIYSQILSSLPHNDERLTYARNCLALLNDKLAANAKEPSG
jgi:hypothetical protein